MDQAATNGWRRIQRYSAFADQERLMAIINSIRTAIDKRNFIVEWSGVEGDICAPFEPNGAALRSVQNSSFNIATSLVASNDPTIGAIRQEIAVTGFVSKPILDKFRICAPIIGAAQNPSHAVKWLLYFTED
jgi:hypothetical protein